MLIERSHVLMCFKTLLTWFSSERGVLITCRSIKWLLNKVEVEFEAFLRPVPWQLFTECGCPLPPPLLDIWNTLPACSGPPSSTNLSSVRSSPTPWGSLCVSQPQISPPSPQLSPLWLSLSLTGCYCGIGNFRLWM